MSRTRHRREDRPRKRAASSTLTKSKHAGGYSLSTFDEPANRGVEGSWSRWLHSYNGYAKQQKRRRVRKLMKTYGRRVARRALNRTTE